MKIKNQKSKIKNRILNVLFISWGLVFMALPILWAKDITILYTGETHAMLYPCSCPREPDGGVARRVSLVKQLRKTYPEAILLDSGAFFAGGLMDEYTQNTDLDKKRSQVNLKAMEMAKYDAANIGDEEFYFGVDFLKENISKSNIKFLSCDAQLDNIPAYIIKDVSGIKVGIIGLTGPFAIQKAQGVKFRNHREALDIAVRDLKQQGVSIVIVLSHMGEALDLEAINTVKDIDVVVTGHTRGKEEISSKVGNTLILRPSWQGRRMGKATLVINDNKIADSKVEEIRLSDKLTLDKEVLNILPQCFSDTDCKKDGAFGKCNNPGINVAQCVFQKQSRNKINLQVVGTKACNTCQTDDTIELIKKYFPDLNVTYLNYPDKKSEKILKEFSVTKLPAYFFAKDIEKDPNFAGFKDSLQQKGDYYMLKEQVAGYSYILNRDKINNKLDVFLSLFQKDAPEVLDAVKDFNPQIHFLAIEKDGAFDAAGANLEVEEYERAVCIEKYYPEKFWDYIRCRAGNSNSSWWENCVSGVDFIKIKNCACSEEAKKLLKDNIELNKEFSLLLGPVFLANNQEIFATKRIIKKDELKRILKR